MKMLYRWKTVGYFFAKKRGASFENLSKNEKNEEKTAKTKKV
jgi:hypothetical protein